MSYTGPTFQVSLHQTPVVFMTQIVTAVPIDTIQWYDDHLNAFAEKEGRKGELLGAMHAGNVARILQE